MERGPERIPAAKRFEDTDRLRAPEVHRQMRRELVRQQKRHLGLRLTEKIESLGPAADEHASRRVWQVVQERGERGGLARMRLLRCDEQRTVRFDDHPAE